MLRPIHILYLVVLKTGVQILQLPPISTRSNVFLRYSYTPAHCFPERTSLSLQLSRVWESFRLNSLKPSLAPPYTLIATHHRLYWEGCAFPGQTRPSVTGLLPSSSSDFGSFPSPAFAVQVVSLPITSLLQWSLEDSKEEPQVIMKQNHVFPFLDTWYGQSCPCSGWF